jgi:hypothetical protein
MSAAYPNLHMLYRDTLVSSDGLLVLGLPFWKTALYGSAASPSEGEPPLELQKTLSKEDIQWLRYHLETHRIPTLVLSYLGPVPFLQKERLGNPSHSFQLPELELLLREPMVAWLCGHIHETGEFSRAWNRSSVLVAYNGKGRLNENLDYRRDYVVRLDPSLADRSTV